MFLTSISLPLVLLSSNGLHIRQNSSKNINPNYFHLSCFLERTKSEHLIYEAIWRWDHNNCIAGFCVWQWKYTLHTLIHLLWHITMTFTVWLHKHFSFHNKRKIKEIYCNFKWYPLTKTCFWKYCKIFVIQRRSWSQMKNNWFLGEMRIIFATNIIGTSPVSVLELRVRHFHFKHYLVSSRTYDLLKRVMLGRFLWPKLILMYLKLISILILILWRITGASMKHKNLNSFWQVWDD